VAEKKTPRQRNKEARKKREGEILERWHSRTIERWIDHRKDWSDSGLLNSLIDSCNNSNTIHLVTEKIAQDRVNSLLAKAIRIIQLKELPYDDYLQTDYWKAAAIAAKKTYQGKCALDEKHAAEHAHHRTYERRGRELPTDVVPLCAACHAKFHNKTVAF
jgi:5-methylcytosine-specific restriction endonuclease McrA